MAKLLIFWGSYAYFPVLFLCGWAIIHGGKRRWLAIVALIPLTILAYARFVEPRILNVHEAEIVLPGASETSPSIRIALIADLHYGVYRNAMPMRRITDEIKRQDVDAVFIAGDFTYHIWATKLPEVLGALTELDVPVYAVLGNHDVGFPGPDVGSPLAIELRALGVTVLDNQAVDVVLGGQAVRVAGSSDLWQGRQHFDYSSERAETPVLLLTHNPDTAAHVPQDFTYDLMLSGHTHGAQIRLPGMVQRVIPTTWPFDKGLHIYPSEAGERLIYVTPGTGMVGLPMRFRMPPRIDVLTVHLPE